jgi:WD40 repeat protein
LGSINDTIWKVINLDTHCFFSSNSGEIFQLDFKSQKIVNKIKPHSDSIFSLDVLENKILSGSSDKNLMIYDIRYLKNPVLKINDAHEEKVFCVQFLTDDVIFSSGGKEIKEWNIFNHSEHLFSDDHSSPVWNFKVDSSKLINAQSDGILNVFDTDSGRILKSIENSQIFSMDYFGTNLVVGDYTLNHWKFF